MNNKFIFHGVGQGLFYSGHLSNYKYNFIYDCGSESSISYLNDAIDNDINCNTIDFILISHLHKDHISGLKRIVDKYKVKTIYLPYFGEGNKNLVDLLIANSILEFDDTTVADEKKVNNNEDFFFFSNLYNTESTVREYNTESTVREQKFKVEFIGLNSDEKIVNENNSNYIFTSKNISFDNNKSDSDRVWEFNIINKRQTDRVLKKLNSAINNLLSVNDSKSIIELVAKNKLPEISSIYKTIFKKSGMNLTSTILIHYPLYKFPVFYTKDLDYMRQLPITILTGDAEFNQEMLSEMGEIINKKVDSFVIFQVPHHGSLKNWNLLSPQFKKNMQYYIIPFGLRNRYRHPSKKIFDDLSNLNGGSVILNTEISSFKYCIN